MMAVNAPRTRALILTRPLQAAHRFARAARAGGWPGPILFAPVLRIEALEVGPLPGGTLVFTSENGARIAGEAGGLAGRHVVAVGARTAAVARGFGAEAEALGGDVTALTAALIARGPVAEYVHLHGRHVTGDLVGALTDAGLTATGRAIYDQPRQPLSDAARAALLSERPCALPLFSPRSAEAVAASLGRAPQNTEVISFSRRVAAHWPWSTVALGAQKPDAEDMLAHVLGLVAPARDD